MNFGETVIETATREVYEETGLSVSNLSLFGVYSGEHCIVELPNKDVCFGVIIIFSSNTYTGEIKLKDNESLALQFFSHDGLPENINRGSSKWIEHWRSKMPPVVID